MPPSSHEPKPSFGDHLRRLRTKAGLTQEDLAAKLQLRRPTPISLMEGPRKHAIPKPATIVKMAKALGVQPWELLEGVETPYDKLRRSAASGTQPATLHDAEIKERLERLTDLAREHTALKNAYEGLKEAVENAWRIAHGASSPHPSPTQHERPTERRKAGGR